MSEAQSQASHSITRTVGSGRANSVWWWRWFWRLTLVVSIVYAWYCFYVPSNSIAWSASAAAAQQESARSGRPILLFFTADWCVPCRIMKRNVWADGQVADLVNAQFVPLMVNVEDPAAFATVKQYLVEFTPSTVITDPEGNILQQQRGALTKDEFLELLGSVHGAAGKEG